VTYLDPVLAAQHGTGEVVGVHVAADVLPLTEVQQHCLGDVAAFRCGWRVMARRICLAAYLMATVAHRFSAHVHSATLADPARAIPNAQRVDSRQLTRLQAYDVGTSSERCH